MKNKAFKVLAMVMVVGTLLTGCGKAEENGNVSNATKPVTNVVTDNAKESETVEQVEGDADAEVVEQEALTTMEAVEKYKDNKMAAYRAAFDGNQISYGMTANEDVLYLLDETYQIFERDYEIEQVAYSLYDYHHQRIQSVISYEYDYHPEKGLSVDDPYVKLLFELIQTTGDEFLLNKFTSCEALATELQGLGAGNCVCATDNCKLMIEKKEAAVYSIQFAHIEYLDTNVTVEPTYMEFATYADYQAFCDTLKYENLVDNVIANPNYKVWDYGTDGKYFTLATVEDKKKFIACEVKDAKVAYGIENNFAQEISIDVFAEEHTVNGEIKFAENEECITKILNYVGDTNIDIEKVIEEMITYRQLRELQIDYTSSCCIAADWFGIDMSGIEMGQYPYIKGISVFIPIKVEGILNK